MHFPVDSVTVSVDAMTGTARFVVRHNLACVYRGLGFVGAWGQTSAKTGVLPPPRLRVDLTSKLARASRTSESGFLLGASTD